MTNTRTLSQDVHVPAKATQNVANMQPGSRNAGKDNSRECEAVREARELNKSRPAPKPSRKDDLSRLSRLD